MMYYIKIIAKIRYTLIVYSCIIAFNKHFTLIKIQNTSIFSLA